MKLHKPARLDWIALAAAGAAGILTSVGTGHLSWARQVAVGVTVGLVVAIVLHIAVRLIGGKSRKR